MKRYANCKHRVIYKKLILNFYDHGGVVVVSVHADACSIQKRALDFLEVKLQAAASCPTWVLEIKLRSFARGVYAQPLSHFSSPLSEFLNSRNTVLFGPPFFIFCKY